MSALDQGTGWCAVFVQRDPDGMRACLDGDEVPPWDVVEALLQDLQAQHGTGPAGDARVGAQRLHQAAVTAYDAHLGGRDMLLSRLDVMLCERQNAAQRAGELETVLQGAAPSAEAERLAAELAWVRDDRARAAARCEELMARLAVLESAGTGAASGRGAWFAGAGGPPGSAGGAAAGAEGRRGTAGAAGAADAAGVAGAAPGTAERLIPAPRGAGSDGGGQGHTKARAPRAPRGSRFAGAAEAPAPVMPDMAPPAPVRTSGKPRGARFAGAYEGEPAPARPAPRPAAEQDPARLAEAWREAAETVARLARLRSEGRTGEAHVVLYEAAAAPAEQLPLLLTELERVGLAADASTLLWEAASLPPARLAAAGGALARAGRDADCRNLLAQGVVRPPSEVADTALALRDAGQYTEVESLLAALLRARSAEEAVRVAAVDPGALVPLLLEAADVVSAHHYRDLVHAMRVAGVPGAPDIA
jgi:hypothetical protein